MLTYCLIVVHFFSDWVLQPREMAKNKSHSYRALFSHLVIIHLAFTLLAMVFGISQWMVLANTLSHGVLDKFVWTGFKKFRGPFSEEYIAKNLHADDYWFYFTIAVDQCIHLLILVFLFRVS